MRKMVLKKGVWVSAFLAVILASGCTSRITDFTVISTKNVDLSSPSLKRSANRIEGVDTAYIVLFIPTGVPNLKEAIDRAIEKVPGCVALTDGVVYGKSWSVFVAGANSFVVEGSPLIDEKTLSSLPSNYIYAYYDDAQSDFVVEYVDKSEFEKIKEGAKI